MTSAPLLHRAALNVSDLDRAVRFYVEALGFTAGAATDAPALAALLGVRRATSVFLSYAGDALELTSLDPPAVVSRAPPGAADLSFQHCALRTGDMARAYDRLVRFGAEMISAGGAPVKLPAASGGSTAVKFRDPDGHPLELIALPSGEGPGIDHSAIVTADAAATIAWHETLGFEVRGRQENVGPEQDALDGLPEARLEVIALRQSGSAMGVELLAYAAPRPKPEAALSQTDLLATRLVFEPAPGRSAKPAAIRLERDPDGHLHLFAG